MFNVKYVVHRNKCRYMQLGIQTLILILIIGFQYKPFYGRIKHRSFFPLGTIALSQSFGGKIYYGVRAAIQLRL